MQAYDLLQEMFDWQDTELLSRVAQVAKVQRYPRRKVLVREGEMQEYVGFLVKGCLCGLSQNSKGEEIVTCFCSRMGDPAVVSFSLDEPATASLVTLTDSVILTIPIRVVSELVQTEVECLRLYNRLLQKALRQTINMQMIIFRGSATERYHWFLEQYPGLINVINNKYIASYLQMSNVTLSRLRRAERERRSADQLQTQAESAPLEPALG